MSRSIWLAVLALMFGGGPACAGSEAPLPASVLIDDAHPGKALNPYVLGNNIAWDEVDPDLFEEDSTRFSADFLTLYDRLKPTSLRYPGGSLADYYHWRDGVGPLEARKKGKSLSGRSNPVVFGTDEFLALCRRSGAEPIITVNVATGTPEEAAAWVRYANRPDSPARVRFWEIGNEPYLETAFPEAAMTPAEYAARANRFIVAMRAADPGIKVGIPLRSDSIGGTPATPFQGFNATVLREIDQPFDFVALHSAYGPVVHHPDQSEEELYLATMGTSAEVLTDLAATQAALRARYPDRRIPVMYTEYNALYSLDVIQMGLLSLVFSRTDGYIDSLAGALYTADALRVFAESDDVLMAQFWAMNANFWFGAIGHDGEPRPQFHVLEAFHDLLPGRLLPARLEGPGMDTARGRFVSARHDVPVAALLAVSSPERGVQFMVLNRHPERAVALDLRLASQSPNATLRVRSLTAEEVFSDDVAWEESTALMKNGAARLILPPHSVSFVQPQP